MPAGNLQLESRVAVSESQFLQLRHDLRNARRVSDATADALDALRDEIVRLRPRVYTVASSMLVFGAILGWLVELLLGGVRQSG